jgi:2-polyprenyl-3-methyl-5-hydroxy-6-metoxy-1,4-benzoquinol methylase
LELESVGIFRTSALILLDKDFADTTAQWAAATGRQTTLLPTGRVAIHDAEYKLSATWMKAWLAGDNDTIGTMLGFPNCCREFFKRTWEVGTRDTTLAQYKAGSLLLQDGHVTKLESADGPVGCNLLLRYLGIRLVPHLPCSFNCASTLKMAERFQDLARKLGKEAELTALIELLSLRTSFSSLHGTAIIETQHFKIEVDADPVQEKMVFVRNALPVEPRKLTLEVKPSPMSWQDNGFPTKELMDASHTILGMIIPLKGAILDLGCGDGALLNKLSKRNVHASLVGVEADLGRVARGRIRHPEILLKHLRIEDLPNLEEPMPFDIVLFMPGRLLEMPSDVASKVRTWVKNFPRQVLYTYDGDLAVLCERTDMPIPKHIAKGFGHKAEAGII